MTKRNTENERIKLRYFEFLRHADGKSEQTIRQVEKAILRFEEVIRFANFKTFDQKQAIDFKMALVRADLAPATILSTVNVLKRFFGWLALQPGYKSLVKAADIAYLSLSEKDTRAASARADKPYPTLQMVEKVVATMPNKTPIEKRNRALIAFTGITGIRGGALVTLKLKHFDVERKLVLQNPVEVATKFGKRVDTFLIPLNDEFEPIVLDWVSYLREEQLFADHDSLFPKTAVEQDQEDCFKAVGLNRDHWANASPIRTIFKAAFRSVGLPEFTPHRFRDMIVSEAYRRKLPPSVLKAWSQNLGHEGLLTTLTSYGKLSIEEQGQLVRSSGATSTEQPLTRSELEDILRKRGL